MTLAPKKPIRTQRAGKGSASEPSLAHRISMCKDAKLSCRGNKKESQPGRKPPWGRERAAAVFARVIFFGNQENR